MSNIKLIFLNTTKFLGDYDFEKYELKFYKNKYFLEIHELIDFCYPNNRQDYSHIKCSKKVLNFDSLETWMKHIKKLNLKFKLIVWFQALPSNFKILKLYTFLKSQNIRVILTHHGSLPFSEVKYKLYQSLLRIPYRLKMLLKRPKEVISWYRKFYINYYINSKKQLLPDFIVTNGSKKFETYKKKNLRKTKIISINSWDFSRYYKVKKTKKLESVKYVCYLSDGGPSAPSDSSLLGQGRNWSTKKYYKELIEFLKLIEKKFKCKVIISAHPRTSKDFEKKNLKYFKIVYGRTMDLIKHASFVVSPGSSSNSYSILFKKPCLFIHSNEYEKNPSNIIFKKLYAKSINSKIIDISKNDYKNDLKFPKTDNKKYKFFSKFYLKSVKSKKLPNFKIIQNEILDRI